MTTDPIARLAYIVAKRTPGPWTIVTQHEQFSTIRDQNDDWVATADLLNDEVFIAAMGSCADELLAVVLAAEALCDHCTVGMMHPLRDSLTALKAKLAEVLP